jgi:ABC-type uncharacterized transport system permease subunit
MTTTVSQQSSADGSPRVALLGNAGVRWALYAAFVVLLLSVTQQFASPSTDQLTSSGTSSLAIRWAVPIMLAGLGGLWAERAGIVNIGLEGMMVFGTWFGAYGAVIGNPWLGVLFGILGGALGGLLHALATVTFRVDHIVSGVAINLLAPGVTRFLSDSIFSGYQGGSISQSPSVDDVGEFSLPLLSDLLGWFEDRSWFFVSDAAGLLGGLVTDVSWLTVVAYLFVPITLFVLWRTTFGLRLRSCGEDPWAAETVGVNVLFHKFVAVVISGGLAGLAGAFIVIELTGIYKENQTNGRGFIGLATMIFGNWRPVGTALGALLFGFADALQLRDRTAVHALLLLAAIVLVLLAVRAAMQGKRRTAAILIAFGALFAVWYAATDSVPSQLPQVVPHILTLVVLVFAVRRLRMPAADGAIYSKGEGRH